MAQSIDRRALVRRAILLEAAIVTYNLAEGVISVVGGIIAGSVVLVGFGLDSAIEVSAGLAVLYHLSYNVLRGREEEAPVWEQRIARFVGLTLLVLALYVALRAVYDLAVASEPDASYIGIAITATSLVVMPIVSRMQAKLAGRIDSAALLADSRETLVCTWLSAATLLGLAANALVGWWWADPVAALVIAVLIAREGREVFTNAELICVGDD